MLSLPLITPRDDLTIWLEPSVGRATAQEGQDTPSDHQQQQQQQQQQSSRRQGARPHTAISQLIADENAIVQRKRNIRRFGAGWLRPPGISKTFQALEDEMAEREEQMMLERRDQQMQDLADAQEQEARRQQMVEAGEAQRDGGATAGEEERDLDDDVPEAGDVTFNEDSLIEGSMLPGVADADVDPDAENTEEVDVERILDLEEVEMSGIGMAIGSVDEERDLDDDVPEAGSYQHTDTELEDESSGDEEISEANVGNLAPSRAAQGSWRGRESMLSETSEALGSSSFLGSSPAARRVPGGNSLRDRLMGARQQ